MRTGKIFILLLALMSCLCATADDTNDTKKQINKIKKSSQYLYAEANDTTPGAARKLAEELLAAEINKWVETKKKLQGSANIAVNNKRNLWVPLETKRADLYRAFVYVKKNDIIPVDNSEVIENTVLPSTVEDISATVTDTTPDVVAALLKCTEYSDFASKLQLYHADGKIVRYARYTSLEQPEACYLAIYNRAGKMMAILTPGNSRRNVATGAADNEHNYSGCGAIGFEVK